MIKKFFKYLTITEWVLWLVSIVVVTVGFAISSERNVLSYFSSLAGVTCVIFNAKGNVAGQVISIVFSVLYGVYAYTQRYYGEMLIYFCLMTPIHTVSIVTWLRNKYNGNAHEVKINSLRPIEFVLTGVGVAAATTGFYFLLRLLKTDNLIVSTISLTTSLTAAYFMLRRCELFSLSFIINDLILIVLWSMKLATEGLQILPSVLCFVMFLANDSYCFINWQRIKKRQRRQTQIQQNGQSNEQQDGQSDVQQEEPSEVLQDEQPDEEPSDTQQQ